MVLETPQPKMLALLVLMLTPGLEEREEIRIRSSKWKESGQRLQSNFLF